MIYGVRVNPQLLEMFNDYRKHSYGVHSEEASRVGSSDPKRGAPRYGEDIVWPLEIKPICKPEKFILENCIRLANLCEHKRNSNQI